MNTIKILIEGYVREVADTEWEASSTTTLITTTNGQLILVDPGANRKLLLAKLQEENIKPSDIEYVFISHHHPDHMRNIALFPDARLIDHEGIYDHDHGMVAPEMIPGTDIKILKTPGHQSGHASLLVPTEKGIVVVAGDVFWWMEGEEQIIDINKKDDFASDPQALVESRKKVLELADWIIPGHGKMIQNIKK